MDDFLAFSVFFGDSTFFAGAFFDDSDEEDFLPESLFFDARPFLPEPSKMQ